MAQGGADGGPAWGGGGADNLQVNTTGLAGD